MDEKKKKYIFRATDFYEMLDKQEYKCPLTGRELTPENTTAEHITPLRKGGLHIKDNIYLIDKETSKIKRYLTEVELINLAIDIVKSRGKEIGYGIRKIKKK